MLNNEPKGKSEDTSIQSDPNLDNTTISGEDLVKKELVKLADELDRMQAELNSGRGVSCVRSIANFLRREDLDSAVNCYVSEYDKIRSYPTIRQRLDDLWSDRNPGLQLIKKLQDL